jgi:hypothetical protein
MFQHVSVDRSHARERTMGPAVTPATAMNPEEKAACQRGKKRSRVVAR